MPECYRTCGFYAPGQDLKCRRFVGGFPQIPLDSSSSFSGCYLLKVTFGRWAKLEGIGTYKLFAVGLAQALERRDEMVAKLLHSSGIPYYIVVRRSTTSKCGPESIFAARNGRANCYC